MCFKVQGITTAMPAGHTAAIKQEVTTGKYDVKKIKMKK